MTLWLTGSLARGSVHSPNVANMYPPYTEIVVQAVQGVSHKLGYRESQAKDAVVDQLQRKFRENGQA